MQRREVLHLTAAGLVFAADAARADDKRPIDPTIRARAELLATLVETGSVDEALRRHPGAKLTPAQLAALREITAAELAAVRGFQVRLAKAKLPELVLRRETVARLSATGAEASLMPAERHSPVTHQAPTKRMSPPTNLPPKR